MARRADKTVLELDEGDLGELVGALRSLEVVDGWVNLTPGVPTEFAPEDRSLFSWLAGGAAPTAPLATWMPDPPASSKAGIVGVLHARGRLHREGIAGLASIPAGWRSKQDHARRGLLFEVPTTTPEEMAEILVAVVDELSTLPTTGRYLAEVFRRGATAAR